jgi:hypothetical protein
MREIRVMIRKISFGSAKLIVPVQALCALIILNTVLKKE